MAHLLGDIDGPEEALPSFMNLDRTTKWLADWLMDGTNHLNFSLGCFLRSGKLSNMLGSTLGADIKDHFRIMIYLTNNVLHRSPGASFRGYSSEELEEMRNQMGSEVLRVISAKLKPAHLEASKAKLQDLQALFLIILGLSITARYSFLDVRWARMLSLPYHFTNAVSGNAQRHRREQRKEAKDGSIYLSFEPLPNLYRQSYWAF